MRRFKNLVQSDTAPDINSLWLKEDGLYYFEGGWKPLSSSSDSDNKVDKELSELIYGNNKEGAKFYIHQLVNSINASTGWQGHELTEDDGVLSIIYNIFNLYQMVNTALVFLDMVPPSDSGISNVNKNTLDYIYKSGNVLHDGYIPCLLYSISDSSILNAHFDTINSKLYVLIGNEYRMYSIDKNTGDITKEKSVDLFSSLNRQSS